MKSSIYFSSEKIDVIGYAKTGKSVTIKAYLTYPLPEGTILNGKITDYAYMVESLVALKSKKPELFDNPTLTIDGNSILSKRIIVPKLNKKQYNRLVRDEFADTAESLEEMVCGYHILNSADQTHIEILACATGRSQVESYMSAFKDAGINLKAIRVGAQAILTYINTRTDLQETTFVLNVIDGITILSMIFENGVNVFMSRSRLYGEGQTQFVQNILENLSGLIQFNRSEKFNDIACSYYLGLNDEELNLMNAINPHHGIKLDALNIFNQVNGAENLPVDAHFSYLNILLGDDSIDLIRNYKMLDKLKKQERPKKRWIPVLAVILVLLAIPIVFFSWQTNNLNKSIDALSSYLENEDLLAKISEIDKVMAKTAYYANVESQINSKISAENSKISISNPVLDLVTKTHTNKVTIILFDFNENTEILHVDGSSATETDSAQYIEALKRNDSIEAVYYTGYSYNNNGEFNFSIDIQITGKEVTIQ